MSERGKKDSLPITPPSDQKATPLQFHGERLLSSREAQELEEKREQELEEVTKELHLETTQETERKRMNVASFSEPSERHLDHHNEDRLIALAQKKVFGVLDGVGGSRKGEQASGFMQEYIEKRINEEYDPNLPPEKIADFLDAVVFEGNKLLIENNKKDQADDATTATILAASNNEVVIAAIGDSPAYVLRADDTYERLTLDDRFFGSRNPANEAEEWEIQKRLSEARSVDELNDKEKIYYIYRNQIGKALGIYKDAEGNEIEPMHARIYRIKAFTGDRFFVFSDGITDPIEDFQVGEILKNNSDNDAALETLLAEAKDRNTVIGEDPITGRKQYKHPRAKPDDKTGVAFTYMPESLREGVVAAEGSSPIVKKLESFLNDLRRVTPEKARQSAQDWIGEFGDLMENAAEELRALLPGSLDIIRIEATYQQAIQALREKFGAQFLAPFADVIKTTQETLNIIREKKSELAKGVEQPPQEQPAAPPQGEPLKNEEKNFFRFFTKIKGLFRRR